MGRDHILIVSPYFYPEGGGLERYAFVMARDLSKNYGVEVLCMTRGKDRVEKLGGIKVYRVKPRFIVSNTPTSLRFILKTFKLARRAGYVVAHTPVPFAVDVASFLAKLLGIPIRVVYHTVGLKKGASLLDIIAIVYSLTVERLTLRGARITAVSHVVWAYLKRRGYNADISYPPLVIDHSSKPHFQKRKIILFVGQLGKYHHFKNLDILIKAFAEVSKDFPEWKLWIVGDGDMLEYYRGLASKLGVLKNVAFFGRVDDPERLRDIYSVASILALPSSFESFGMVVPEALSAGTPVVVSSNVGAKILVENGKNGLVLREISSSNIRDAVLHLIENPKLLRKMGRISAASVDSYPSPQFQL